MMESLAALFREVGAAVSIERIALDPPGPTEVLVHIAAVGLCRTDYHVMRGERGVAMRPMLLGHEAAGVVKKTEDAVGVSIPAIMSFSPLSRLAESATGAGKVCIICAPRARASRKGRNSMALTDGVTATALRSAPFA